MKKWIKFENDCFQYLKDNFKEKAIFEAFGKSDSTKADIKVNTKTGKEFFIEIKKAPAQCGQFVLIPNNKTKKFDYSSLNVSKVNTYSQKIIDFMNANFEEYKEAGTKGKDLTFNDGQNVFANWIIDYYKNKDVKYVITNNYTIFPLDMFSTYFDIQAKYRIKKSGSSEPTRRCFSCILEYLKEQYNIDSYYLKENSISEKKKIKMFIKTDKQLKGEQFKIADNVFQFSETDENNNYEIRKLSNTFNANVIFSIKLKKNVNGLSNEEFISFLTAY